MARIDVLTSRPIGPVDRRIFGSFTEHLGRCVYGGLFDEGSPLSGPDGFRTDVLGAVRDLGVTNVRWPGGNFVSGYHWTDGIGPDRPRRPELAWHTEESNRFGTDEFLAWSAAAGVQPVLCLNMGTGTLDEALAWVEYCNGAGDTYWAGRRRANGRAEPYGVRYWGLGNEMYGNWQLGQRTAAEYVTEARRWAKALKRLDPGIRLVSCGQTGLDDWDRVVIDGLARYVDFHSIHLYTGSADYWSNVLAPHYAERALSVAGALIDRARYVQRIEHEVFVAYDEWNVWYRTDDGRLEERYNLADALAVATYLNVFVRQCWTVRMANLAQLVNVIAPIVTSPEGLFTQSIYHPFRLMATASLPVALDTCTDSGTHAHRDRTGDRWPYRVADLGLFQLLDVAATADPERSRLTLSVVNRDPDRAIQTRIRLHDARATGVMTVHEVTGAGPAAVNTFARPDVVSAHNAVWPDELRQRLRRLHADHDRLTAVATAAERTLCHLDVWPANLVDDDGASVLLDWSFTGEGAVGEDVANLIIDSFSDGLMDVALLPEVADAVTEGYLQGLRDGGWTGSAGAVRTAIAASGAAKYHWLAPAFAGRAARDDSGPRSYGQDASPAEAVRRLTPLVELIADWADAGTR